MVQTLSSELGKFCINVGICMGLVFWEVNSMEVYSGFVLL